MLFFFAETFRSFLLKHFGHLSHSCIETHHITVFFSLNFQNSDQNDLVFLVISKTFWSMTEK